MEYGLRRDRRSPVCIVDEGSRYYKCLNTRENNLFRLCSEHLGVMNELSDESEGAEVVLKMLTYEYMACHGKFPV